MSAGQTEDAFNEHLPVFVIKENVLPAISA
jgi:hypothetical protein